MRISWLRFLAVALVMAGGVSAARADDIQFVSYSAMQQIVTDQNERIGQLEARLASMAEGAQASPSDASGGECGGCEEGCGGDSGWFGNVEVNFLKYNNVFLPTNNYVTGYRLTAGYQGCCDVGVRVRYFDYEQTIGNNPGVYTDFATIDAELTSFFHLPCCWDGQLSGGVRYAEHRLALPIQILNNPVINVDGWGLVMGVELSRPLGCETSFFALARESILMGDIADVGAFHTMSITEMQMGAEWKRERCQGGYLFARAAVEAQYWNDSLVILSESLMGGNFSVGITR